MRRRRYNRGRWAVERERHHLEAGVPPAAEDAPAMAEMVPALLRRLRLDENAWVNDVQVAWPQMAGPGACSHSRVGRYQQGTLTVFVDSSVWMSEIQRQRPRILAALQQRFSPSRIRAVRYELDPGQGPAEERAAKQPAAGERVSYRRPSPA